MAYTTDDNGIPILKPQSLLSDVPAYTEALDTLLRQLMPLGTIAPYYKSTAPNDMWLICNGDPAPAHAKYNEYRDEIGANTPNLQGRTLIGQSGTYAFDSPGGESAVTLSEAQMPSHSHSTGIGGIVYGTYHGATGLVAGAYADGNYEAVTFNVTSSKTGSSHAHNNMQPYLPINYIILASYEA